jgi:hypothetical protein
MKAEIKQAPGTIPGLYDIHLENGTVLRDLTANQVSYVIAKEGLVPASGVRGGLDG